MKKEDGLAISRMKVGKAPHMHATRVPSVREFSPTLAVGDMQTMSFPAAEDCVPGDGPLWMTPEENLLAWLTPTLTTL